MCLLAYCGHDATPDYDGLWTATLNNPDGFGWAVHLGDRIITGRAMSPEIALDTYKEALSNNPGKASMFHARYATHGAVTIENCHPFQVGASRDTVLAHNGIISDGRIPDGMSDTRWFAEVELPRRGLQILDKDNKFAKLERYLGSKVIVFTTREDLKYGIYILNERMGDWVDGVWWSNDSYRYVWGYKSYSTGAYTTSASGIEVVETCPVCFSQLSADEHDTFGYCLTCEACLDCESRFAECLCFSGSAHTMTGGWDYYDTDMRAIAAKAMSY